MKASRGNAWKGEDSQDTLATETNMVSRCTRHQAPGAPACSILKHTAASRVHSVGSVTLYVLQQLAAQTLSAVMICVNVYRLLHFAVNLTLSPPGLAQPHFTLLGDSKRLS
jgi:hypothetical protein